MSKVTENRKRAAIYREAARLLERKAKSIWNGGAIEYACEAIDSALGISSAGHCAHCYAMKEVFAAHCPGDAWLSKISSETADTEEDRPGRILALCFMAAVVEAGDA